MSPTARTATRATIGVSILAAYPTRSKRMYRADFGFPLTRSGTGGGTFEVRFTSEDRTGAFWREPDDVHAARTGAVASTLFVTPVIAQVSITSFMSASISLAFLRVSQVTMKKTSSDVTSDSAETATPAGQRV